MPTFENITPENLLKFRSSILQSELAFPESIRCTYDDYLEIIRSKDCIAIVALEDEKYLGNIIACEPDEETKEMHKINEAEKVIYIYNIIIDKEFQGRGYGNAIVKEFLAQAKSKGYAKIIGHFRAGGALQIIKKFGAEEKITCQNWENTAENYVFCELDIGKAIIEVHA